MLKRRRSRDLILHDVNREAPYRMSVLVGAMTGYSIYTDVFESSVYIFSEKVAVSGLTHQFRHTLHLVALVFCLDVFEGIRA